jgi:hypothetical protein
MAGANLVRCSRLVPKRAHTSVHAGALMTHKVQGLMTVVAAREHAQQGPLRSAMVLQHKEVLHLLPLQLGVQI